MRYSLGLHVHNPASAMLGLEAYMRGMVSWAANNIGRADGIFYTQHRHAVARFEDEHGEWPGFLGLCQMEGFRTALAERDLNLGEELTLGGEVYGHRIAGGGRSLDVLTAYEIFVKPEGGKATSGPSSYARPNYEVIVPSSDIPGFRKDDGDLLTLNELMRQNFPLLIYPHPFAFEGAGLSGGPLLHSYDGIPVLAEKYNSAAASLPVMVMHKSMPNRRAERDLREMPGINGTDGVTCHSTIMMDLDPKPELLLEGIIGNLHSLDFKRNDVPLPMSELLAKVLQSKRLTPKDR